MKKIPLALFAIVALVFALIIPEGEDLISVSGDGVLGSVLSILFIVFLVIDIKRYKERKNNSISNN